MVGLPLHTGGRIVHVPDDGRHGTSTLQVPTNMTVTVVVLVHIVSQTPDQGVPEVPTIVDGHRVTPRTTTGPVPRRTVHVRLVVLVIATPDPDGPGVQVGLHTVLPQTRDPTPVSVPPPSQETPGPPIPTRPLPNTLSFVVEYTPVPIPSDLVDGPRINDTNNVLKSLFVRGKY